MKKKLVLGILFIAHSLNAAPAWWNNLTNRLRQTPGAIKRTWYCAIKPAQYNCTQAEHKRGLAWVAAGGTALATILLGAGISISNSELQRQEELARQKTIEEAQQLEIQEEKTDAFGRLMVAIILDIVPLAQQSIKEGANVNQRTQQDILPLEQAMLNKNKEMVALLLLNGADPRFVRKKLDTTQEILALINKAQFGLPLTASKGTV